MSTSTGRTLPWRRYGAPISVAVAPLLETFAEYHPEAAPDRIVEAYQLAFDAHDGQTRKSGAPYVSHPLAVAKIVANNGLDDTPICAALLHDAVEDTAVELSEIEARFGPNVAALVDGVTKLERVKFETKEEQQAATYRKMLVAMSDDIRVLIIKLSDRLHNLRTLAGMAQWKQRRTAQETLDIYAPLAHRLGMQDMKQQLEDLCFATLHPQLYAEIEHMVAMRDPERDLYLHQVMGALNDSLSETGVEAQITGRPKNLWSIYEKMVVRGREFDEIYDLIGIRVIVQEEVECYSALHAVHKMWQPVQGRFKDYVAMPKFNLYQSLHTTVVGPQSKVIDLQIRTQEMEERAEFGVATHWNYKRRIAVTGGDGLDAGLDAEVEAEVLASEPDLAWVRRVVESETEKASEYLADLKMDLDRDEVHLLTPRGKVITLQSGSTPVDFAYAIHTEVGHSCHGARINGRLVPLETQLRSGDTIEIYTSTAVEAGPSEDWLDFAVSAKARSKIRNWFSKEQREDLLSDGSDQLVRALRREGLPGQVAEDGALLEEIASQMNYADSEALLSAVGQRHVRASAVVARIGRQLRDVANTSGQDTVPTTARRRRRGRPAGSGTGVHVEGLDDVMVRLSGCCTPVPPDEIMGFNTKGRGVSVHRVDCSNAVSLARSQGDRSIEVEWDEANAGTFTASIELEALDRPGLLRDITQTLAIAHVNIVGVSTLTGDDRVARMNFEFELGDGAQLGAIVAAVKQLDSVYEARRAMPTPRR